jgi:hypothetical protein
VSLATRSAERDAATIRSPSPRSSLLSGLALSILASLALGGPTQAAPPDEGTCPSVTAAPSLDEGTGHVDAPPMLLKEGMTIDATQMLMLRNLVPPVIWQHREVFFYEGMKMLIGNCHRRYATFKPYRVATERFAGEAKVDKRGNLENYTAGLPFPARTISRDDPRAAVKWAWNLQQRYQGAGFRGHFRISEIPSRIGGVLKYEGKFFYLQTRHRTDFPNYGYAVEAEDDLLWAAGGSFSKPFDARHLAWRQFRTSESLEDYDEPDNMFVYMPTMRKQRRAATNWVDGLYIPTYTGGDEGAGGSMPFGGDGGSIAPTAGLSISASQDKGHGLTGLVLRPNAYHWRYLGEQTVLAPSNIERLGYPQEDERNYGTSGLSIASDRWDVRYAVIIEGAVRTDQSRVKALEIWIDYQTQQPLFWITRTKRRRLQDIGILAHRFSGDIPRYPEWEGGIPASVFEPVGAFFYDALSGGGGWRRESYDVRSTPFTPAERRIMTSADNLGKGR